MEVVKEVVEEVEGVGGGGWRTPEGGTGISPVLPVEGLYQHLGGQGEVSFVLVLS